MTAINDGRAPVPRDPNDDYTRSAADARRAFLSDWTGATFEHVSNYSFEPAELAGAVGLNTLDAWCCDP
jgi:hydroxymethylglutaryl-CoA reductase (NADPH)